MGAAGWQAGVLSQGCAGAGRTWCGCIVAWAAWAGIADGAACGADIVTGALAGTTICRPAGRRCTATCTVGARTLRHALRPIALSGNRTARPTRAACPTAWTAARHVA